MALFFLLGVCACTHPAWLADAGASGSWRGVEIPSVPSVTRMAIEAQLAQEATGKPPPWNCATWPDYWVIMLRSWHGDPGGERWIAYLHHRREKLGLPPIYNWA